MKEQKIKEVKPIEGFTYEGEGVFDLEEPIDVDVSKMSKDEYDRMEKEMSKATIEGKGYRIYAWNDCSGYDYWKHEGDDLDFNYIMITARVNLKKIDQLDTDQMLKDAQDIYDFLYQWDNI